LISATTENFHFVPRETICIKQRICARFANHGGKPALGPVSAVAIRRGGVLKTTRSSVTIYSLRFLENGPTLLDPVLGGPSGKTTSAMVFPRPGQMRTLYQALMLGEPLDDLI